MSHPTPDPISNEITASAPAAAATIPDPLQAPVEAGNLPLGVLAGSGAALVGAVLWAVITVATEFQIGFMAVGVGYLVGTAVGKFGHGQSTAFRVAGAALALAGCVLGNFFTLVGFASGVENGGVFATLAHLDYSAVPGVMAGAASPMDFLFYGIATYEGFKLSAKN